MPPRPPQQLWATPAFAGRHEDPHLVFLEWADPALAGHALQVYVDDQLACLHLDAAQSSTWLRIDRSQSRRLSALLVPNDEPADLQRATPQRLEPDDPPYPATANLLIARSPAAPDDASLEVRRQPDLPPDTAPLWPGHLGRPGFGGLFGIDDHGFDHATGPGLGRGQLGMGPLGADGVAAQWHDPLAPQGTYTVQVATPTSANASIDLTVERPPQPPTGLTFNNNEIRWSPAASPA